VQADEIRFLYAYDGWATRRVLSVLDDLAPAAWTRRNTQWIARHERPHVKQVERIVNEL
jgi:uncharacterized damage-inducible protein DinB